MIDAPMLVISGGGVGGCGHWLPEDCEDQVNRLVTGFLTQP